MYIHTLSPFTTPCAFNTFANSQTFLCNCLYVNLIAASPGSFGSHKMATLSPLSSK